jgi:inorganic triphosphatase YgiF
MGQEFELKYRCDQPTQAQILESFPGTWATISMETTYYDTPQADFSRKRWTLRRRFENGISVCTLKTPGSGGSCGEWEMEADDVLSAIPHLIADGAPAELAELTADGILESCAARFTRLARKIALEACTVELALDAGLLMGGGRELPFAEVEVELKAGSEEAAIAFAQNLAEKFNLVPEPKSKLQRALELTKP